MGPAGVVASDGLVFTGQLVEANVRESRELGRLDAFRVFPH
jgi:hypothetical protein